MHDEELLAFAEWCRINKPHIVYDPIRLRNVFNAYDGAARRRVTEDTPISPLSTPEHPDAWDHINPTLIPTEEPPNE